MQKHLRNRHLIVVLRHKTRPNLLGRTGRKLVYDTRARRVAQFARGSAGPGPPAPLFTTLPRGGSLSSREAVLVLCHPPHYLRHFREAGRSVRERQCWSCVARPIIYDTSARRVAQFARGSAGPASPAPLFTTLPRGGCLSSREAALVLCRPPHYLRHFRGGQAAPPIPTVKHERFESNSR